MKISLSQHSRAVHFFILSAITLGTYNNCSNPMHSVRSGNVSSSSSEQQATFKCVDRNTSSKTKNYILSKAQYQNTIEDLFGTAALTANASVLSTLLPDSNNKDDHERQTTISPAQAIAFYDSAQALANYVISSTTRTANVFGACANLATPAPNCVDTYLSGFAKRLLRRPLTAAEIAFAKQIILTTGSYKENLKAVLAYHLSSPAFLWLLELGTPTTTTSGNRIALTPYEVATRLAYFVTDSTPDSPLLAAADDGSLMVPAGLEQQVKRLLVSTRGKTKTANSLLRWALAERAQDLTGLPTQLLNGVNTSGLQNAMNAEAQSFVNHIVYNTNGSLNDLLTSKLSFASHPGLATIYGHSPMTTTPVTMSERRQGLLMKAPFLTWNSFKSNIILRGVNFQKRVLCNEIPSPSVDIVGDRNTHELTEDELLTVTNRAAVTYQTEPPVCMGCHRVINPVGFVFEGFDPLGRIRSQEMIFDRTGNYVRSLPVHTNVIALMPGGTEASVADAYDLVSQLAKSPSLAACVTKNMYRYFYEKKESQADDCQLQDSFDAVTDSSTPLINAIEKIFTSQTIYYKEI